MLILRGYKYPPSISPLSLHPERIPSVSPLKWISLGKLGIFCYIRAEIPFSAEEPPLCNVHASTTSATDRNGILMDFASRVLFTAIQSEESRYEISFYGTDQRRMSIGCTKMMIIIITWMKDMNVLLLKVPVWLLWTVGLNLVFYTNRYGHTDECCWFIIELSPFNRKKLLRIDILLGIN